MHNIYGFCSSDGDRWDLDQALGALENQQLLELLSCQLNDLGALFAQQSHMSGGCRLIEGYSDDKGISVQWLFPQEVRDLIKQQCKQRFKESLREWVGAAPEGELSARMALQDKWLEDCSHPEWPENVYSLAVGSDYLKREAVSSVPSALGFLTSISSLEIQGPIQQLPADLFKHLHKLERLKLELRTDGSAGLPPGLFNGRCNIKELYFRMPEHCHLARRDFSPLKKLEKLKLAGVDTEVDADLQNLVVLDVERVQFRGSFLDLATMPKLLEYRLNSSLSVNQQFALARLKADLQTEDLEAWLPSISKSAARFCALYGIKDKKYLISAVQLLFEPAFVFFHPLEEVDGESDPTGTRSQQRVLISSLWLLYYLHSNDPDYKRNCRNEASNVLQETLSVSCVSPAVRELVFEFLQDECRRHLSASGNFSEQELRQFERTGFPSEVKQLAIQRLQENIDLIDAGQQKLIATVMGLVSSWCMENRVSPAVFGLITAADSYSPAKASVEYRMSVEEDEIVGLAYKTATQHEQKALEAIMSRFEREMTIAGVHEIVALLFPQAKEMYPMLRNSLRLLLEPCKKAVVYRSPTLARFCLCATLQCSHDSVAAVYGRQGIAAFMTLALVPVTMWLSQAERACDPQCLAAIDRALGVGTTGAQRNYYKQRWVDRINGPIQSWLLACKHIDDSALAPEQKLAFLRALCTNLDEGDPLQCLEQRMRVVCALQLDSSLADQMPDYLDADYLHDVLMQQQRTDSYLELGAVDNLYEKYAATIGSMRFPDAWRIYQQQICQVQDPALRDAFQKVIKSILYGSFHELRCRATLECAHGERLREIDEATWQRWQQPVGSEVVEIEHIDSTEEPVNLESVLREKVRHHHLTNAKGESLQYLIEFLSSDDPEMRARLIEKAQHEPDGPVNRTVPLQLRLMQLCDRESRGEEWVADLLAINALELASKRFELGNDIKALQASFQQDAKLPTRVLVVDSIDWQDLFLCGTEVAGSCQRIDGSVANNRCLLAYLLDAKNRLLALKDPVTGVIMARAIFRLLIDSNDQLALFQEWIYPERCPAAYTQALDALAERRARELGLLLYRDCTSAKRGAVLSGESAHPEALFSLGSPAPWEYADAAQGVSEGGIFKISNFQAVDLGEPQHGSVR